MMHTFIVLMENADGIFTQRVLAESPQGAVEEVLHEARQPSYNSISSVVAVIAGTDCPTIWVYRDDELFKLEEPNAISALEAFQQALTCTSVKYGELVALHECGWHEEMPFWDTWRFTHPLYSGGEIHWVPTRQPKWVPRKY